MSIISDSCANCFHDELAPSKYVSLFRAIKPGPSPEYGIYDGPSLSRIAGVIGKMALPWSITSKNTNSKHQITNKSQIQIFNDQNLKPEIGKRKKKRGKRTREITEEHE